MDDAKTQTTERAFCNLPVGASRTVMLKISAVTIPSQVNGSGTLSLVVKCWF